MTWRAKVHDSHRDFFVQNRAIVIVERGEGLDRTLLRSDGLEIRAEEAPTVPNVWPGLVAPVDALPAIADALDDYLGRRHRADLEHRIELLEHALDRAALARDRAEAAVAALVSNPSPTTTSRRT